MAEQGTPNRNRMLERAELRTLQFLASPTGTHASVVYSQFVLRPVPDVAHQTSSDLRIL